MGNITGLHVPLVISLLLQLIFPTFLNSFPSKYEISEELFIQIEKQFPVSACDLKSEV